MTKLDKTQHTKQEYRRLKALEKAKKREDKSGIQKPIVTTISV